MRADAKKSLAEMNEGRNLKNGIGVEVDQLNPVETKKTAEKKEYGNEIPR